MKKSIFAVLLLAGIALLGACTDYETYGEMKEKERDDISKFIKDSAINVISETVFDARSQLVVYALTGQVVFRGQASDFDRHSLSLDGIYIINETKFDGSVICRKVRIDRY